MNEANQNINLENRKELKLTGVNKIESLNKFEFLVITTLGNLTIKGNDLEMINFDIDKGNLHIKGLIDSIMYSNKSMNKSNKGFIQKLFK